jgi:hypothetical protein
LKLTANGTSYGVPNEFIVDDHKAEVPTMVYHGGKESKVTARKHYVGDDGQNVISDYKAEEAGKSVLRRTAGSSVCLMTLTAWRSRIITNIIAAGNLGRRSKRSLTGFSLSIHISIKSHCVGEDQLRRARARAQQT